MEERKMVTEILSDLLGVAVSAQGWSQFHNTLLYVYTHTCTSCPRSSVGSVSFIALYRIGY